MAQPRTGGVLRVAIGAGAQTDGYDPALWTNDFCAFFATARHGFLTEIGPDGQLIGEVAQSWDTADAINWVLKIRAGIRFHSGKALTADDVIASINHHRGTTSPVGPLVAQIVSLTADGMTLKVTLAAANVDFPLLLADYNLPILPASDGRLDLQSADGCGPYRVLSYFPGVEARLERHPDYWKPGRAHVDAVQIFTIADSAARLNALQTGMVDLIDGVAPAQVAALKRQPGLKVLATRGTRHAVLAMDSRVAPLHDPHLRRALKFAIDRQALVDDLLLGHGHIANDHPIAPTNRYFNSELPQTDYDPDRARFHLAQAGVASVDLTLVAAEAAFVGAVQTARMFAGTAKQAGINLEVSPAVDDQFWGQVWRQTRFCSSVSRGRPTEDWIFSTAYAGGAPLNDGHWTNPRFDTLLGWARSELSEGPRQEMYWEMQAICAQDGAVIAPVFADYLTAFTDKLMHDDAVSNTGTLDGFRAAERWWFA